MIRADVRDDGIVLVGAPAGSVAYVDRDWLPASSGPVPSLSVSPEGLMAWCDGQPVQAADEAEANPDRAAALVMLGVAREAAAAVMDLPSGSVEIIGNGLIAHWVRALVGDAGTRSVERPRAVVEVTGDPAAIVDATRRVVDLGTVVLVGEVLGRRTELSLYADVHMRGLTLVGVAPPLHDGAFPAAGSEADELLLASSRESLSQVRLDSPLPLVPGSTWYRVSS